jgi:paraquat-inducible protein B
MNFLTTWTKNIKQWINEGLKLSLQTGNLLTGGLFLEFGFYPTEGREQIEAIANYKVIPSTSSGGLSQLSAQMSDFLNKLNNLNIEKTLVSIDKTLLQFSQLAEKTETLVRDAQKQEIPAEINTSLRELQATLKDFQRDGPLYGDIQKSLRTLEQLGKDFQSDAPIYEDIRHSLQSVEQLSHDFQNGAPAYNDIRRALQSIEQLTRELQPFSKSLNEHPSMLIFDKTENDDVQPLRGTSNE